jgi:glycine cleavage system regulatory protein
MLESLVVTLIGADRPGIVARLAAIAADNGAGWEESKMARLAGRFAGIVRLEVQSEDIDALENALAVLRDDGIRFTVERGSQTPAAAEIIAVELVGHNRRGIVRNISAALAKHQVSIEKLDTEIESASMSGESLFRAQLQLRLPEGVDLDALRADLEAIADDLMVDLRVESNA